MIGDMAEAMSEFCLGFTKEQIALGEEKLRQKEEERRREHIRGLKSSLDILKVKRNQAAEAWDFFNLEKIDKQIQSIEIQLKELLVPSNN